MNLAGLITGLAAFLIIGLYHPVVIKTEYHFGTGCWWAYLLAGLAGLGLSLALRSQILSTIAGVFAFSSFWGIGELFEQRRRVSRGWFPENPRRAAKNRKTDTDSNKE